MSSSSEWNSSSLNCAPILSNSSFNSVKWLSPSAAVLSSITFWVREWIYNCFLLCWIKEYSDKVSTMSFSSISSSTIFLAYRNVSLLMQLLSILHIMVRIFKAFLDSFNFSNAKSQTVNRVLSYSDKALFGSRIDFLDFWKLDTNNEISMLSWFLI